MEGRFLITIYLNLFATLKKYAPPEASRGEFTYQVPPGTTIHDLIKELGIPEEECKQAFINRYRQEWDYELQEGDRVALFSPIAGG